MKRSLLLAAATAAALWAPLGASAGPIFLTGHDPDFHAQGSLGAQNLLNAALNFVTGGTYNTGAKKFLWVESTIAPPSGHLIGKNGLIAIGLTAGTNFDTATAAQFSALTNAQLAAYSAIAIASDFGGLLTSAEIGALDARAADIASFVNAGGGLFAAAECGPGFPNCQADLVTSADVLFGFVPLSVSSVATSPPFTVTPYGATTFGLTNGDVNDPTHNSFGPTPGLNIVDTDSAGHPTTLAGDVQIGGGGFVVPEPASLMLLGSGLFGLGVLRRRGRARDRRGA